MTGSYQPYICYTESMKQIESFIRHWPRAVFLMLAGALSGWVLWMFLPQQYTAIEKLSVSIDYNRTGKLDDLQEDRLLGITEDMIHSDRVMKTVFSRTGESDYLNFFNRTSTTRTNQTWSLKITGKDPKVLGSAAVVWQETAYNELRNALNHAVRAEALANEIEGLSRCIQDKSSALPSSGCGTDIETTFQQIENLSSMLSEEQQLAGGISTAIRLGVQNPDQLQIKPASRTAAISVTIGALAGLVLSFAAVWFRKEDTGE